MIRCYQTAVFACADCTDMTASALCSYYREVLYHHEPEANLLHTFTQAVHPHMQAAALLQ
jgi:hypothetical protein